jgi:hypothetical protein
LTRRLNITNGDSAAGTLSEAGIEGKIISWRDVLHEGPVDSSLPLEELSKQRARFISERRWDDFAHVSGDFAERDRVIQHLDYFDEIVLWFEDDLYDQLQLIQLLDFLGRSPARRDKTLSLIQVDGYIPPLSAAKLKELDAKRSRVTAEQFDLARRAWRAFGSGDPSSITTLLEEKTSALPYLAPALRRHLEEFPAVGTGLSRSEREALTAIDKGHTTPVAAFLEVAKLQESIFLGDIVFYSYLERLSGNKNPLVTWADGTSVVSPSSQKSREFVNGELKLTPLGREVLAAKRDWQTINAESRWLGGVEIQPGGECWRWDPEERVVVRGAGSGKREGGRGKRGAGAKPRTLPRPAERKAKPRKKAKSQKARPAAKKAKPRSAATRSPRRKK